MGKKRPSFLTKEQKEQQNNIKYQEDRIGAGFSEMLSKRYEYTLMLDYLLADTDFIAHLLSSHVFFHGKIGFFETLLDKIHAVAKKSNVQKNDCAIVHKIQGFRGNENKSRVILIPQVKSSEEVNGLVASAFSKNKGNKAVWLVAQPGVVQNHLLLNFKNFFISYGLEEEIKHFRSLLSLPDSLFSQLIDSTKKEINNDLLFVTNYEPLVEEWQQGSIVHVWLRNPLPGDMQKVVHDYMFQKIQDARLDGKKTITFSAEDFQSKFEKTIKIAVLKQAFEDPFFHKVANIKPILRASSQPNNPSWSFNLIIAEQ